VKITLNGDPYEIAAPISVTALLIQLDIDARRVAVEHNLVVLKRVAFDTTAINDGDEVESGRSFGRKQKIVVRGLADRNVARADARKLYEDLTPAPTREEIEQRKVERLYRAAITAAGTPDKRDRRLRRKIKEEG